MKEETGMKRNGKRLLMIAACIYLLILIVSGFVILVFFPEVLSSVYKMQNKATKELFAMDTYITMTAYGQNAEEVLPDATDKLTALEQLRSVTDSNSEIYVVKLISFAL